MNEEKLRAFVRGYWENADHETKKGEPEIPWLINGHFTNEELERVKAFITMVGDFWYERGIKDLAEMVLGKLGEKE